VDQVVANASRLEPGSGPGQLGPVIDTASYNKIISYIEDAEKSGANKIVLDGRSWKRDEGNWVGPTIILHTSSEDKTMFEEVFGPVLSLNVASSWEEAIGIENANPFWKRRFHLHDRLDSERAWVGVNVGVPVPREPFSFGGLYGTKSKYGDMDITGDAATEFFTNRIKITTKWPIKRSHAEIEGTKDSANFAGQM
jgi:malonate-semialdehyde dehydrogenase (acetylating)/methylmalonate-semialdehyde dehydrogenase